MDRSVHSQFSSIKLDQLVYVELEARNGGMMLTVSEEGFTFRAVTSVRPSGRIPFSFVINGTEKLEGHGEIKWTKDEGKVAGLQFTDVSTEFLTALRKWLVQLSTPAVPPSAEARASNSFSPDRSLIAETPQTPHSGTLIEAPPMPEFGLNFGQSLDGGKRQHVVSGAHVSKPELSAEELPRTTPILSEWKYPDGLPAETSSRGNGVVIAAAVASLLLLAVLLYSFRETIGRSLISLGQKLSAPSEASHGQIPDASEPSEEVQPQAPANSSKQDNTAPPPQAALSSGNKSETNQAEAEREKTAPPPANAENQFSDKRPGSSTEEDVTKNIVNQNPAEQIRILWAAVGQGNTSAEVTLAKLYMIGGGVPKNCDQARVLLRAAAKKGNTEAIAKLSQITRQGCP